MFIYICIHDRNVRNIWSIVSIQQLKKYIVGKLLHIHKSRRYEILFVRQMSKEVPNFKYYYMGYNNLYRYYFASL